MPRVLLAPASFGDVLDRITILELKHARVADDGAREHVSRELAALRAAWVEAGLGDPAAAPEHAELTTVNAALWDVEDALRDHEARGVFDEAFVALARAVYRTNDRRAALKRAINLRLDAAWTEQKVHPRYEGP